MILTHHAQFIIDCRCIVTMCMILTHHAQFIIDCRCIVTMYTYLISCTIGYNYHIRASKHRQAEINVQIPTAVAMFCCLLITINMYALHTVVSQICDLYNE